MDNRPIGVFDSGLGGLTSVKELKKILPDEDIIYFGDTGRIPYGTRSIETIIKYTKQDINFLKTFNIKGILIACGTMSSVALPVISDSIDIPVYGVVESACASAVKASRNKKIGILGTNATVNSRSYEIGIKRLCPEAEVFSKACPMFVPLVENGYFNKDNKVAGLIAAEYLEKLIENGVDTIILGCTHYPILTDVIKSVVPNVTLINSGKEAADNLSLRLRADDALCEKKNGVSKFYVSDTVDGFVKAAEIFLGEKIGETPVKIDIEKY